MQKDQTTEEKIKQAAKKIFHEKGYGQTRTREIAEAAGINTALLNYYFRSKENLFNIIMLESVQEMFSFLRDIVNDSKTSIIEKTTKIVDRYVNVFYENPNLPVFVLSEIQANPERLMQKSGIPRNIMTESHFFKQLDEQIKKAGMEIAPLQIFLNIVSLSILPVVGRPIMLYVYTMGEDAFKESIKERQKLIPMWIKLMLKLDE